jgi:hypothetical protein
MKDLILSLSDSSSQKVLIILLRRKSKKKMSFKKLLSAIIIGTIFAGLCALSDLTDKKPMKIAYTVHMYSYANLLSDNT